MLRSLKATPSVCLVLLRNRGAEVVLSHPVIFLNFSSSAGCSGCPEPSYLRSLMPSARYSPFSTSVSAFFVQCSRCRQSRPYPRRLSAATIIFFSSIYYLFFFLIFFWEREKSNHLQPMCIIVTTFEFKTVVPSPYDLTNFFWLCFLLSGNNPHPFPVEYKVFSLIKVLTDGGSSAALDLIRVVLLRFLFCLPSLIFFTNANVFTTTNNNY